MVEVMGLALLGRVHPGVHGGLGGHVGLLGVKTGMEDK